MCTFYVDRQDQRYTHCDNCDAVRAAYELRDVCDFTVRIEAGDEVPAGQCPDCDALCYLATDRQVWKAFNRKAALAQHPGKTFKAWKRYYAGDQGRMRKAKGRA